jgi:hypothetical protein
LLILIDRIFQIATPNPWKAGTSGDSATQSCGRKVNENKLLTGKKTRFNPYKDNFEKCRICRTKVHQVGSHYCQECAYKKGICAMCGVKILKTKNYKQSSV